MNRHLSLAIVAIAIAAGSGAGYWFGSRHAAPPAVADGTAGARLDESGAAPGTTDGKAPRKLLYYRNPMGLPDTSPEPKKDSMGMDYIAVYADEGGDGPDDSGVVKVSPARLQTLGVKTARAEMTMLDAALRAVGRVEVDERRTHDVAPRFEGWIERLYVNATGDPVRQGQPLFSVYSPELVSAQKELRIAEELERGAGDADPAARAGARRLAEAARERLRNWKVGAAAGKQGDTVVFASPASGVVLEKKAVEGMRFMAGAVIYRIADLASVWVIADVYEKDLARVKLGEAARVVIDAFPGQHFDARVTYLYPTLNAATRTTPVRLELKNHDGLLRPGMFAHVEIATAGKAARLTVPKSAVIDSGDRQVVLLVLGEGKYKPQAVQLGLRGRDAVEILDGVQVDDQVVVAANFLIDAESNLKAALATFTAPEAKAAAVKGAKAAKAYQTTGSLDSLDVAANTVSVTHEPIPALKWPAMTMEFGLASPEVAKGIAPGAPIRFDFEDRGDGEFVITRIHQAPKAQHEAH
ncbi:efflux RND transporter periplasmic adaptor subunit [Candidatus Accumulibacter sp. ACC003]|uniref:efflux RND transporter periplasmic adaptor subunit n=1 Tax=Candidatus Accumulibacter sp. ACC003 TaxID=2823334 RepID=UPI0025C06E7D|nr:efflux RND transporter periplasmic adaptor subunit [Candidatus Accumulibacter sp. ACC003]